MGSCEEGSEETDPISRSLDAVHVSLVSYLRSDPVVSGFL